MHEMAVADSSPARPGRLIPSIVAAWVIAGTIDIVVALAYYRLTAGVASLAILHGIASGVLGPPAFQGGAATAAFGLACHYTIALIWTLFFFAIYPRVPLLWRSRLLTAVLYGTFVSAVMTFVVLPLSNVRHRPFSLRAFVVATVILMVSIGLPLAIVAGRYYAARLRRPA